MQITQENIGELNAVIEVQLTPDDYKEKVRKTVNDYSRKMNLPGFRPGKVPSSVIQKMYGKSILAEEINKLTTDAVNNYINEKKLRLLAEPIPHNGSSEWTPTEADKNDWNNPSGFKFSFEVGLAPEFEIKIADKKFTQYEIELDDETWRAQLSQLKKRHGTMTNPEISEADDYLYTELAELDERGNEKGNGKKVHLLVSLSEIKNEKMKKSLMGKKKDDSLNINIRELFDNDKSVMARELGIAENETENMNVSYKLDVKNVNRVQDAELNQELFDKTYGKDAVKSEEEFLERYKKDLQEMFAVEAESRLQKEMRDELVDSHTFQMPDAFLKKWIRFTSKNQYGDEQIEKDFPTYIRGLRWSLIENKIIQQNNLEPTHEEIDAHVEDLLKKTYGDALLEKLSHEQLHALVHGYLDQKDNGEKTFAHIRSKKAMDFLKGKFNISAQKISYKEFSDLLAARRVLRTGRTA